MTPGRPTDRKLRILHVLRAPLGGLFRHVVDLAEGQIDRGHAVGIIADSTSGDAASARLLERLAARMDLGLLRIPMPRNPHPRDFIVATKVMQRIRATQPDVVHGHGSKGGLYARLPRFLPGMGNWVTAYTPHGGSLHAPPDAVSGAAYMLAEAILERATGALLFESAYIGRCYEARIGGHTALRRTVVNGLKPHESQPVLPADDAADFLFIGELRTLKGIDVLLDATALVAKQRGRAPSLALVGTGPDERALRDLVRQLGLDGSTSFLGRLLAREAFARGRVLVVPSRAESLPYVVLEAAAAGVPMLATNVGGIPEIFGSYADTLLPPGDAHGLARAMNEALDGIPSSRTQIATNLATRVTERFTIENMIDSVLEGYRAAMLARRARTREAVAAYP